VTLDGPPDAIVVGGGVTGCSCALALATRGLRVRLHEAREIAGGASGRYGASRCAAVRCRIPTPSATSAATVLGRSGA
jgi:glycine/D-amino acid oxidase-like deaminating enzyme